MVRIYGVLSGWSSQIGIRGRLDPGRPPDPCHGWYCRNTVIFCQNRQNVKTLVILDNAEFLQFSVKTLPGPPDPWLPDNHIVKNRYNVKRFFTFFCGHTYTTQIGYRLPII